MNLIRYYNQNRKKIWGILIIIFSAFILLQLVNTVYNINRQQTIVTPTNDIKQGINTKTTQLTDKRSVVTGEKIEDNQLESAITTINKFISYCNEKEIQKAYELLTDKCKEQLYNTIEIFEQAYYNDIFNGEAKTCSVENWMNNTYKVKIMEDILSTGRNNNSYTKQDYITVEKQGNEYKLNINNYVGSTNINKTTQTDNISMKVINKNTYMEYEVYTIEVTNHTKSIMVLDSRTDVKSLYLEDRNGNQYPCYSHELIEPMLTVHQGETKQITIKFYSSYITTKKIEAIVFSDVTLYDGQLSEGVKFKANI
ncbi:MAG: hypothetical protein HFJ34_02255 [Clostridia bacterium]|nr:hypothetical protein [Clostridia bacterium]